MNAGQRQSGLDIVRSFAILFVLSVHFFLNTYFYSTPIIGKNMYFETFFRMFFMICVPLFLVLTGYLQTNKMPTKSYYKKLLPILMVYIIYSILSLLYFHFILNDDRSLKEYIYSIFNFSADGYSWYINMYIGLFLLSPYLNILYKNIPTKKQKILLISSLLFVTSFPDFFNRYIGGQLFFSANYWIPMYPITYYFLGSFIKEYQIKINKFKGALLLIVLCIVGTIIEIFAAKGNVFSGSAGYFGSLIIAFQTVVFFLVFYDINIKSKLLTTLFALISVLSLDIYLASFISDKIVYSYFLSKYPGYMQQELFYFAPIVVLSTFLLAFIMSYLRHKLIRIR
ncbi:acyltransferase family protein [Bacillus sp. JJ1566]|uniref:acyltransferase n=1 Tax=Bacillus sp. JJ1566 TaxID=3122961 RepID=UPI002FFDE9E8